MAQAGKTERCKMGNAVTEKLRRIPEFFGNIFRRVPKPVWIGVGAAAAAVLIGLGVWRVVVQFRPTTLEGIDVSHYQGDISWRAVAENHKVKFVYVKASEGSSYQDPNFTHNRETAAKYHIAVGAYHYYSISKTGTEQADNFISAVPKKKGSLPPAIDIEANVTSQSDFKSQLSDYVSAVTKYYGQKPVFYVPPKVYNLLYDDYAGYHFWVIDVNDSKPSVTGWTFWQYSNKGKIAGISGNVDLDRYRGSLHDFDTLLSK